MNKFIITGLNIPQHHSLFAGINNYIDIPYSINLELRPIDENNKYVIQEDLNNLIRSNEYITILPFSQMDSFIAFQDEFKEFLVEKYPEKILKDQYNFTKLFGKEY